MNQTATGPWAIRMALLMLSSIAIGHGIGTPEMWNGVVEVALPAVVALGTLAWSKIATSSQAAALNEMVAQQQGSAPAIQPEPEYGVTSQDDLNPVPPIDLLSSRPALVGYMSTLLRATGPRGEKGKQSRAWRNRNPGNLRLRVTGPPVDHVAVDNDAGGPFGIYANEAEGWADLIARVIQIGAAKQSWTVAKIVPIWAPEKDGNNTAAYITHVAGALGVKADDPIDPRKLETARKIAKAVQSMEGSKSDPPWDEHQFEAGLRFGGAA